LYTKLLMRPCVYNIWSLIHSQTVADEIAEIINEESHASILDLGCGTGRLRKYFPLPDFTGIDTNKNYIAYAKKKVQGRFIAGDIMDLGKYIGGLQYNYIILCGLLHHLNSFCALNLMADLHTHLQPEGELIYIVDHVYTDEINMLNKILLKPDRGSFVKKEEDYHELFKGFTLLSQKKFNIQIKSMVLWSSLTRFVLQNP